MILNSGISQTKKWIDSSPAVSKEENVYFCPNDDGLYALSSGVFYYGLSRLVKL